MSTHDDMVDAISRALMGVKVRRSRDPEPDAEYYDALTADLQEAEQLALLIWETEEKKEKAQ